jgi:hypothetical protein
MTLFVFHGQGRLVEGVTDRTIVTIIVKLGTQYIYTICQTDDTYSFSRSKVKVVLSISSKTLQAGYRLCP